MEHTDVFVSGGGIAGLSAAVAFGQAGFDVICVDPVPPITDRETKGSDLRTTAFLQPSQNFLERIGLWARLADHATPLDVMRIIDAGGHQTPPTPRIVRDFKASDVSDLPFGWNLPNWLLKREFLAAVHDLPNVTFLSGVGAAGYFARDAEARIKLIDGRKISAKLAIAADGRASPLRQSAGIDVKTTRFGQAAMAFAVTHSIPHENVSTEIHRSGGPFTLVPLPDYNGAPCSAVVWMEDGPNVDTLMAQPTHTFEKEATKRSCEILGPLKVVSRITRWPIIAQRATSLTAQRLALVAEAAHVVPPIGAQGLNMSLADIRTLYDLALAAPQTLGNAPMLADYEKQRAKDIHMRVAGITALNTASQFTEQSLRDLRALGLNSLYSVTPVRKTLMNLGLGAT